MGELTLEESLGPRGPPPGAGQESRAQMSEGAVSYGKAQALASDPHLHLLYHCWLCDPGQAPHPLWASASSLVRWGQSSLLPPQGCWGSGGMMAVNTFHNLEGSVHQSLSGTSERVQRSGRAQEAPLSLLFPSPRESRFRPPPKWSPSSTD